MTQLVFIILATAEDCWGAREELGQRALQSSWMGEKRRGGQEWLHFGWSVCVCVNKYIYIIFYICVHGCVYTYVTDTYTYITIHSVVLIEI